MHIPCRPAYSERWGTRPCISYSMAGSKILSSHDFHLPMTLILTSSVVALVALAPKGHICPWWNTKHFWRSCSALLLPNCSPVHEASFTWSFGCDVSSLENGKIRVGQIHIYCDLPSQVLPTNYVWQPNTSLLYRLGSIHAAVMDMFSHPQCMAWWRTSCAYLTFSG